MATKTTFKLLQRGCNTLLCLVVLLTLGIFASKADAQVSIRIGGPPPVCPYGYYDYAPYACAPSGFYGPGYFYNGIFLGVGPWANWGYGHGWGSRRFISPGGGRYRPGYRYSGGHYYRNGHRAPVRPGYSGGHGHPGGGRPNGGHPANGGHANGGRPNNNHPGGGHGDHR